VAISNNFGSFAFVITTLTTDETLEAAQWNAANNVLFMFCARTTAANARRPVRRRHRAGRNRPDPGAALDRIPGATARRHSRRDELRTRELRCKTTCTSRAT